jgi:hypothetical protein
MCASTWRGVVGQCVKLWGLRCRRGVSFVPWVRRLLYGWRFAVALASGGPAFTACSAAPGWAGEFRSACKDCIRGKECTRHAILSSARCKVFPACRIYPLNYRPPGGACRVDGAPVSAGSRSRRAGLDGLLQAPALWRRKRACQPGLRRPGYHPRAGDSDSYGTSTEVS